MTKELTINIIPSDYEGDYKKTLGYCWADYATKTPGLDIVVDVTNNGVDYTTAVKKAIKDNGADSAYVNCMWCGGFSGIIEGDETDDDNANTKKESAPITIDEEYAQSKIIEIIEQKTNPNNKHVGWCNKCNSYCYGDCEAN